jgi:uncharacterized protein (TIGR00661 family)
MKILYGIQGTGNGHVSRARAMAKHFTRHNADVDYLFSGRKREDLFGMEVFGDFATRGGLTFSIGDGKVSYPKTLFTNNPVRFVREVLSLDLSAYDVVVNDFEPVSAWAARLQGKQLICFGHQPAFHHNIPVAGGDPIARSVLKYFAPGRINIGLHWHHFNQPILPPIIHFDVDATAVIDRKILVYLPFENQTNLIAVLQAFTDFQFYLYAPEHAETDNGNIHLRPFSVDGFQYDLKSASAVMCNAGFELPSECLQLGKKLLVKPVHNQMEQASNVLALERLGLADSMQHVDALVIARWLSAPNSNQPMNYPDVAGALVQWLLSGEWDASHALVADLWKDTAFAIPAV